MTQSIRLTANTIALAVMFLMYGCASTNQPSNTNIKSNADTPITTITPVSAELPGRRWAYTAPHLTAFNIMGADRHSAFHLTELNSRHYTLGEKRDAFAFHSRDARTSVILIFRSTQLERDFGRVGVNTRDGTLEAWMIRDQVIRDNATPDGTLWEQFLRKSRRNGRGLTPGAIPMRGSLQLVWSGRNIKEIDMELYSFDTVPKFESWLTYHEALYESNLERNRKRLRPGLDPKEQRLIVSQIHTWHELLSTVKAQRKRPSAGPAIIDGKVHGTWMSLSEAKPGNQIWDPNDTVKPVTRLLN